MLTIGCNRPLRMIINDVKHVGFIHTVLVTRCKRSCYFSLSSISSTRKITTKYWSVPPFYSTVVRRESDSIHIHWPLHGVRICCLRLDPVRLHFALALGGDKLGALHEPFGLAGGHQEIGRGLRHVDLAAYSVAFHARGRIDGIAK
jgi:hypothetical protein